MKWDFQFLDKVALEEDDYFTNVPAYKLCSRAIQVARWGTPLKIKSFELIDSNVENDRDLMLMLTEKYECLKIVCGHTSTPKALQVPISITELYGGLQLKVNYTAIGATLASAMLVT